MTTYFSQLQEQYDDVQEAYRAYVLGKTIHRVSYHKPDAPENIKQAMNIQEKINSFAKDLITNPKATLLTHLGITQKDIPEFYRKNSEALEFIGVDRNLFISLITTYPMQLNQAAGSVTWESLQEIIEKENNNTPIIDEQEVKDKLQTICEDFAITSITFGKGRTNIESINNANESLNQLSLVLDTHKQQIGSNKFNLFFDTEDVRYAGYSTQFGSHQKLYLNERLSYDAFAHEWLHGVDSMMAEQQKLTTSHASEEIEGGKGNISSLLAETIMVNEKAIEQYKEICFEKTLTTLSNTVNRFKKLGYLKNTDELKEYLHKLAKNINENNDYWSEDTIKKVTTEINKYYQHKEITAYSSFVLSELELLHHVKYSKKFNESLFYNYAVKMDNELRKVNMVAPSDIYSTERCEMFARAFETYTDIKLASLNVKNIISDADTNSYTPRKEEMMMYLDKWKGVIDEMKETLSEIYPVKYKPEAMTHSSVALNIKKMRKQASENVLQSTTINKL